MLDNLDELLTLDAAKPANPAKNGSSTGLEGYPLPANDRLKTEISAKKNSSIKPSTEFLAVLADLSQGQNELEPTPIHNLSRFSRFSRGSMPESNPFCSERTFEEYGLSLLNSEKGMSRLTELHKLALETGCGMNLAFQFAEAAALFEHLGDGRTACLECRHFAGRWGKETGICQAAGNQPLTNMKKGAEVHWHWLNRCPKHEGFENV